MVVWLIESAEGGRDEDRALSLSGVMTVSGAQSVLIAMISCIDNGGCMKEGSIRDQRQAVESDVDIGQRWQRWGPQ